ncbi:MAG: hypothetical protein FJ138_13290 [Deltaproteobacteria bacterium]|nr:hypothetical protein [Deltaproteobacteria bacterium]
MVAKMGTMNARKGQWSCVSPDLSKDTYGRILWRCEDLSNDQIRKGFAHAMSVTEEGAEASDVAAQREAIAHKRGIWAHGVPEYVLTSIHSVDEGGGHDGKTYNRLVSVVDGHSLKWRHEDTYEECQDVCWRPSLEDRVARLAARLSRRAQGGAWLAAYSEQERAALVKAYMDGAEAFAQVSWKDEAHRAGAQGALDQLAAEGWVDAAKSDLKSCMVYVDFRRRFGAARAVCLK